MPVLMKVKKKISKMIELHILLHNSKPGLVNKNYRNIYHLFFCCYLKIYLFTIRGKKNFNFPAQTYFILFLEKRVVYPFPYGKIPVWKFN